MAASLLSCRHRWAVAVLVFLLSIISYALHYSLHDPKMRRRRPPLPCLHVTHGLSCPSPPHPALNLLLPKYVKVNLSPASEPYFRLYTVMVGPPHSLCSHYSFTRENSLLHWHFCPLPLCSWPSTIPTTSLRCLFQWCCRGLAVRLRGPRSSLSPSVETDPAACLLPPGSPAVILGYFFPAARCSPWACCSCCSVAPWWRYLSALCLSVTRPPSVTRVRFGPAPR